MRRGGSFLAKRVVLSALCLFTWVAVSHAVFLASSFEKALALIYKHDPPKCPHLDGGNNLCLMTPKAH